MKITKNIAMRSAQGFTLIELMVVVVIVAILMGIALPSYQDSVRKARRSDAMSALMDAANRQEQVMLDTNSYSSTMAGLGMSATSPEGDYTIGITTATVGCPITTCYVLTATPVTGSQQANDAKCDKFTLTSTGTKTANGTLGSECW